jgi:hypothetical protein
MAQEKYHQLSPQRISEGGKSGKDGSRERSGAGCHRSLLCACASGRWVRTIVVCLFAQVEPVSGASQNNFVIGVGTHLLNSSRSIGQTLKAVSEAGATSIRDDAKWAVVETEKGQYRIPARWDAVINLAIDQGVKPVLILDYGNRFYDGGRKPRSQAALQGFRNYAAFVVQHFRGRVSTYEIWNEWELTTGHTAPGSAEDYVRLLQNVYPSIKKIDPQSTFLAGAVGGRGIRGGYLRRILELGALKYADGLSLHTYIHCNGYHSRPEDWAQWMGSVESELAEILGKSQAFYVTEMGWPSNLGRCGVSSRTQADYLRSLFKLARSRRFIKGIWWYDLQDDGTDRTNRQHNFGLVRRDFSRKPAFYAFKKASKSITSH